MSAQLPLFGDDTLPITAGTHQQIAVVFTALGGPNKGKRVYRPRTEHHTLDWLRMHATALPPQADARIMQRVITPERVKQLFGGNPDDR